VEGESGGENFSGHGFATGEFFGDGDLSPFRDLFVLCQKGSDVFEILTRKDYHQHLTSKRWGGLHSRNGMRATSSLSSTDPFHLSRRRQFSGCKLQEAALVSRRMTLSRSRFK